MGDGALEREAVIRPLAERVRVLTAAIEDSVAASAKTGRKESLIFSGV